MLCWGRQSVCLLTTESFFGRRGAVLPRTRPWRSLTLAGAGGADRVPDDQSGATTVASQRSGYCPQVVVGAAAAEVEDRRLIVVSSSPRLVGVP